MVRAKFVVDEKKIDDNGAGEVFLSAVYDSDPDSENGKFFEFTPSAEIRMSVVNTEAMKTFEEGKEYYVDFKLAE